MWFYHIEINLDLTVDSRHRFGFANRSINTVFTVYSFNASHRRYIFFHCFKEMFKNWLLSFHYSELTKCLDQTSASTE